MSAGPIGVMSLSRAEFVVAIHTGDAKSKGSDHDFVITAF
jgi:hypothetical protein